MPVAVPVYVVVVVGETDTVLDATGVDVPTPLSILKALAFSIVHERADDEPILIAAGEAESVQDGAEGGGVGVTVSVVAHVAVPPAPVTVPM